MIIHLLPDLVGNILLALVPLASVIVAAAVAWVARWTVTNIKSTKLRADVEAAVLFAQQTVPLKSARYTAAAEAIHALWGSVPTSAVQALIESSIAAFKLANPTWEAIAPTGGATPTPPPPPAAPDPLVLAKVAALQSDLQALLQQVQGETHAPSTPQSSAGTSVAVAPDGGDVTPIGKGTAPSQES